MATPAPVAPPPTTIMSHTPGCALRRRYISDLVMIQLTGRRVANPPQVDNLPHSALEDQLQGELALSRRVGAADGPEGGTGGLGVRYPEVRVVQNVEELRPELQAGLFADPEVLVD